MPHAARRVLRGCRRLVGVLALAACQNGDAGAAAAAHTADPAPDSAGASARAGADSLARWRARFGNRVPKPDSVRALYVNGWAAGSRSRMRELIRIADSTEINAFVIDFKESDTYLVHNATGIELAKEIGADQRPGSRWLPELIDTLQAHGIYPIARIVVFKDRMLAEKKPELAIRDVNGGIWKDAKGKPWVNPYSRTVWDYNIAIAREALELGFSELQWDYVRFPDVTETLRRSMAFPGADGTSPAENIRNFLLYAREQLKDYQVPLTADVFGLVTHMETDVGIGQNWEKIITAADAVLPMVYPSHYYPGMYGFQQPNAHPYEIVRISMQDAVERTAYLREHGQPVGEIRPWLQAFTADYLHDGITYGPGDVRQQIQAAYDAGLKSWTLWNPGSNYVVYYPALRPASGALSQLEQSGWKSLGWQVNRTRLSKVILKRETAARAAQVERDSAAVGG